MLLFGEGHIVGEMLGEDGMKCIIADALGGMMCEGVPYFCHGRGHMVYNIRHESLLCVLIVGVCAEIAVDEEME